MKSKELDLSKYRDSELVPIYKTETKLQILKDYFKNKEKKAKDIADTAGTTAVVSGFMTPFIASAIGLGYATNPEAFTTPSMITAAAIATLGIASGVTSYIIHKNQRAKQRDYKELKEFAEAGISSNIKLEKVQNLIRKEGTTNLSTLEKIDNLVTQKQPHYCDINNMITETAEELVMQK